MSEVTKKSKRILTFDLLRGYFMVSIILNHLQWYPNGLDWVAFRGSLFVSAAEGFFFISGIVLGIIRGRKLIDVPFKKAALLLINRGVLLYVISVVLMLIFTVIGWMFMDNPGLKAGIRPMSESFGDIITGALSLNYIYGWADFLRLYGVFLIASPFALLLLRKNKWPILLAINIGFWALFPYAKEYTEHSTELLMILSWQLIFFGGMTLGFYWDILAKKWTKLTTLTKRRILFPILATAIVTLFANLTLVAITALPGTDAAKGLELFLAEFFNKEALSPLRILLFGLWFTLGFYIFSRYEDRIVKALGWILLPFGQNSLYVYILHAIILFFAHLIIAPETSGNIIINAVGSVAVIGLILLAVKKKFLFKIIPR
ncbi:OpgC domain-containing protein [Candidatus Saccharibacteria bacterium TM7i]|nr:OpgC domain-containing protein [Candidatus Saccharibacteria bacterium TM7i]